MNKKATIIAGAALLALGLPTVSHAQASGPFADVPADHWAYQAVDTLQKAGIVIGYPDGTYGGRRAMTRYEFAEAIARLLPLISNKPDLSNYATKDDLAALRQDLENKLAANQDAIAALQKLVNGFEDQLTALGQDVAGVKDRLNALEARVAAVEEEQRRIKFTGALNIIAKAENITKGQQFVDQNGSGPSTQDFFADENNQDNKKLLANSDVYTDFVLGIKGRVSDTATANVKLDFGNYLDAIGNTAAAGGFPTTRIDEDEDADGGTNFENGIGSLDSNSEQFTLWEANLEQPVDLGPLGGADLVAGRFGNQWTKWTLMQVDADVYTQLYQLDSGNITTDGAKLNLKLGPVAVSAFAGEFRQQPFSQIFIGPEGGEQESLAGHTTLGFGPQSRVAGQIIGIVAADSGAGARFTIGTAKSGTFGVSVEQFGIQRFNLEDNAGIASNFERDPNNPSKMWDRVSVYGADYNGGIPLISNNAVTLDLAYNVSALGWDNGFNNAGQGWRYTQTDAELGWKSGAFGIKGGYQTIGPDYTAPGYWGKIGGWTNPNNVEGGVVAANYAFSPKLALDASYQDYKAMYGRNANGSLIVNPLQQGDSVQHYLIGLNYGVNAQYKVDLGYEGVSWDLKDRNFTLRQAGKPTETYWNIGFSHPFNPNATFRFLYQIAQYRDKGTEFGAFSPTQGDQDGNVAEGQFER